MPSLLVPSTLLLAVLLAMSGCLPFQDENEEPTEFDRAWPEPIDADAPDASADASADAMPDTIDASPDAEPDATPPPPTSPGCGAAPQHLLGGTQTRADLGPAAGGERSFYLTLPQGYDPATPHRLIIAYAGTDWSGEMIRPYFNFDRHPAPAEIHVYPDLRRRDFGPWGEIGGWLLGPHATPADGMEDIEFTRALITYLAENYCIDPDRIFATGHSWGGDMAAVVACFLGDHIRAAAPAAANRPYWFEPAMGPVGCVGDAAVWTFFGQDETHFVDQDHPGQYGDEQVAFWRAHHACAEGMGADASEDLPIGAEGECVEYTGCQQDTRYCFYDPSAGHQIPDYFTAEVLGWFRSF